jgi:hypothetical protein
MEIGVTGHQLAGRQIDWVWVTQAVESVLREYKNSIVVTSCLATGADQIVSEVALAFGGSIKAIVPFEEYETTFRSNDSIERYRYLLSRTLSVQILKRVGSDEEQFFCASCKVVDCADLVIAVWDGRPAEGAGGTADVVDYVVQSAKPWIHINPNAKVISRHVTLMK